MNNIKILVGKIISSVVFSGEKSTGWIVFHTIEGEKFQFDIEEQYEAAKTWIENISGLDNLIGEKIILVKPENDLSRCFVYDISYHFSLYTINIITLKGTFTVDYRTYHDGIDDGELILSREKSIIFSEKTEN